MTRGLIKVCTAVALLVAAALSAVVVGAREPLRLRGVVLATPAAGSALVHHAAFGGMPAMTMTYRVPAEVRLRSGDRISAEVDRSTDPWSLRAVHVLGTELPPPARRDPALVRAGEPVPDGVFIDQRGQRFSLRALSGKRFAVTFMYTRCLDATMCPLISAKLRAVQQRLRAPAALVEVSLDPAYDRPPVLARYARAYGADPARWHMLTGDPRTVLDFAARFGILEHAAGPVAIVHSERLAIVDRGGRISAAVRQCGVVAGRRSGGVTISALLIKVSCCCKRIANRRR